MPEIYRTTVTKFAVEIYMECYEKSFAAFSSCALWGSNSANPRICFSVTVRNGYASSFNHSGFFPFYSDFPAA